MLNFKRYIVGTLLLLQLDVSIASKYLGCGSEGEMIADAALTNFKLVDLMEMPIFLSASQKGECANTAANIVSTITGEELLNMGARDLIDAMDLMPGFSAGSIMTNVVSFGFRGIQGDEGKVSILIDGILITDQRFGTTGIGAHFPVEHIDRIEVIRGPGSIKYGNFSELGVINIITKKGRQIDGGVIGASYGRFSRGEAGHNTFVNVGKQWDDLELSFYGKYNDSYRSDRFYTDAHGGQFDMANQNELGSLMGNLQVRYKDLNIRFIIDEYTVDSGDGFADTMSFPDQKIRNQFSTYALELDYQYKLNTAFKIGSNFNFSRQTPWQRSLIYADERETQLDEKVSVDHFKFDLKGTYSTEEGNYLMVGNSFQFENYEHDVSNYQGELPLFGNYTLYGEGVYKTAWANILLGLRLDWYTEYGFNAAPRFALTKQFKKFHYKFLYSQSFHAPTGGTYQLTEEYNQNNIFGRTREQINSEQAYTYELELGYQLQRNLDITANVFYTEIQNYFIYSFDENFDDFYRNAGDLSTWGIEAILNYQHSYLGRFKVNYGFYQAVEDSSNNFKPIDSEGNIVNNQSNLGLANHKLIANHNFKITDSLSFNHTVIFYSERYGHNGSVLVRHKPTWVYNTYLRYQNVLWEGLEVGLGLYDVFNSQYQYVQMSNGSHPALPGNTREVRLKLSYQF